MSQLFELISALEFAALVNC